jgi:hypothetical protein
MATETVKTEPAIEIFDLGPAQNSHGLDNSEVGIQPRQKGYSHGIEDANDIVQEPSFIPPKREYSLGQNYGIQLKQECIEEPNRTETYEAAIHSQP